jgi:hypothetical protein
MAALISLWLPILLSAVAVFFISFILHAVLTYHNSDFSTLPDEGKIMDDLRKYNVPPGDYMMPYCDSNKERQTQEYKDKLNNGPVSVLTIFPNGQFAMGGILFQWFIYCVIISIFVAYIAGLTIAPGTNYMFVFRITGTVAFVGYSLALIQQSIWYKKSWSATLKSVFDGLIYALFTAGFFGWLWPAM